MKIVITLNDKDVVAALNAVKDAESWLTNPSRRAGEILNVSVRENAAGRTRYVGMIEIK